MYTAFAQVYDEMMADVNYIAWADFYRQVMQRYGLTSGKVAECACGTGNLTLPLQRMGFAMTGIDISPDMLWQASQKARKEGLNIPFIRQDMCHLRLHRAMDAVLATCDGVNYLTAEARVREFFAAAFEALRPGGILVFDVSTPYKLSTQLGNNLLFVDGEQYSYAWQNHYHEATRIVDLELAIFKRQEGDLYRRLDERQQQRAHTFEELQAWLAGAGFSQIACYGDRHMGMPGEKEKRWHIAARKPQLPLEGSETNPRY